MLSVSLADQQNSVVQTIHSFSGALTEATTRRIQVQAKLRCREAIIDGEVAAPDEKGVTRVSDVRGALQLPSLLAYFTPAGAPSRDPST